MNTERTTRPTNRTLNQGNDLSSTLSGGARTPATRFLGAATAQLQPTTIL